MELFIERGFEQVTVTEVAEAADVSVNTVYNYFPTKEDLFFGLNQPMETSLAGIVRQREKGEPLLTFLRHLLLGSLEPMKAMPPPEQDSTRQQVFRVIRESPTLQARGRQMTESVEEDLAHAFAEDMGTQLDDIVPRLVAQMILTLYSRTGKLHEVADPKFDNPADPIARHLTADPASWHYLPGLPFTAGQAGSSGP